MIPTLQLGQLGRGFDPSFVLPGGPKLQLPMEGSNGGVAFSDTSFRARSVSNPSNLVTTSTAVVLEGSSSARFPGTSGAALTVSPDTHTALSGDFTIVALVQFDTNGVSVEALYALTPTSGNKLEVYRGAAGSLRLLIGGSVYTGNDIGLVSGGEPHWVIYERVSGVLTIYLDGNAIFSVSTSSVLGGASGEESVGAFYSAGSPIDRLIGYLDHLEVYDSAIYNGTFTAPQKFSDWSYRGAVTAGNTGSGTTLAAAATALTAGDSVFVFVRHETLATTVTISDTAGNTYTPLTAVSSLLGANGQWFYCLNAAGHASNVITVTWAVAQTYRYMSALAYRKPSAAFDVEEATGASTGSDVTSGSFTTAGAGLLLVGEVAYNNESGNQSMALPHIKTSAGSYYSTFQRLTRAALVATTVTVNGSGTTNRALAVAHFT